MRNVKKQSLTDERRIETLKNQGVLIESSNPSNPNQKGFRFSKSCFFRHSSSGIYVRLLGFVVNCVTRSVDIICVNCMNGSREKLSSSTVHIKGHLFSAVSHEEKYNNRPKNEELFVVAPSKKEAMNIIKELSTSGFWSLDRNVSIHYSSLTRII